MAEERGYEWIATSGGGSSHRQDSDSAVVSIWVALLDPHWFLQFLQLIAPILLAFLLHLFLETVPNVKFWLEKTGYEALTVLLTLAISGSLGMAIWAIAQSIRKQKESHRKMEIFHAKNHDVMHHIRDCFCATEHTLDQQLLGMKNKADAFYATKYPSDKQMKAARVTLLADVKASGETMTREMVRFFLDVCDAVSSVLEFWSFGEKLGCCIRIAQETKESEDGEKIAGYCTLGWSKELRKRCPQTEVIYADEGIAKIISDGIVKDIESREDVESGADTKKCVVLVKSIKRAIDLGDWTETANDNDSSIRSVMILPINFRRLAVSQDQTRLRIDGLLYITSEKEGDGVSPFSPNSTKQYVDAVAAVADVLGGLVYRLNQHCIQLKKIQEEVERRTQKEALITTTGTRP